MRDEDGDGVVVVDRRQLEAYPRWDGSVNELEGIYQRWVQYLSHAYLANRFPVQGGTWL